MIDILTNVSLKQYNSFGIDAIASYFIELKTDKDIQEYLLAYNTLVKPIYYVGSGANTIFTKNFKGTIVHVNTKGIEIIEENNEFVYIKVKAGEIWDEFVNYCVKNNYFGMENLVAIPGKVGATPIQNIGAYGVEAKDVIESVYFYNLEEKNHKIISNEFCDFSYRNSIFKNQLKDKVLITDVIYKLNKKASYKLDYGSINETLKSKNILNPSLKDITSLIRDIRGSKLPDISIIGNAGSFFKNPIITIKEFEKLKKEFPNIVSYPINSKLIKVAAGWLIDNAGLKSFQIGGAAVHNQQALVIINKENASGEDVVKLSKHIQNQILKIYNIPLSPEVIFV